MNSAIVKNVAKGFLLALVAGIAPGCASTGSAVSALMPAALQSKPVRMLAIVTPSHLEDNGQPVQQGTMCRVYFFEEKSTKPVRVHGDLEFTLYDMNRRKPDRTPNATYKIPEKELAAHVRKDIVGDSYLFWLPYEPKGKTRVTVQGRFLGPGDRTLATEVASLELIPSGDVHEVMAAAPVPKTTRRVPTAPRKTEVATIIESNRRPAALGAPVIAAKPVAGAVDGSIPTKSAVVPAAN